ncbi:hypothetical protein NDU88_004642 [Pleurodeles waltl]|uniref:Uncharacterized protein n=1 Tax=Pleurodeles waltl TaxID=8319 RepID=A0AAV7MVQ6_PLEWA|nr:hypothetical protein NDU88_004642 [Pleurodeles waltl]
MPQGPSRPGSPVASSSATAWGGTTSPKARLTPRSRVPFAPVRDLPNSAPVGTQSVRAGPSRSPASPVTSDRGHAFLPPVSAAAPRVVHSPQHRLGERVSTPLSFSLRSARRLAPPPRRAALRGCSLRPLCGPGAEQHRDRLPAQNSFAFSATGPLQDKGLLGYFVSRLRIL